MAATIICAVALQLLGAVHATGSGGFDALKSLVISRGGRVHEALALQCPAPCGADRGICCTRALSMADVSAEPLIVVPETLEMNGRRALAYLTARVSPTTLARAPLDTLDDGALLVLWLAARRRAEVQDEWTPYVAMLPRKPTCAWLMSDDEADQALARAPAGVLPPPDEVRAELEHARSYVTRVSQGLARDYGAELGFEADDVRWAMAIVSSRAMGGSASPRLVPLLDLLNHHDDASGFVGYDGAADAVRRASGSDSHDAATNTPATWVYDGDDWAWWSFDKRNQPRALAPGDECCANYAVADYSPLEWFINTGFVGAAGGGPAAPSFSGDA